MPFFYHRKNDYVLATNYKVMYSSLYSQKDLIQLAHRHLARKLAADRMGRHRPYYLLARNPYDRLVSFFCDKFRENPFPSEGTGYQWQRCQKIFFRPLGIVGTDEEIEQGLRSVSFDTFIGKLPVIYRKDRHLYPQNRIRYFPGRFVSLPFLKIRFAGFFQMETDQQKMREKLAIDTTIKYNQTRHRDYGSYFTDKLYRIVNRLYKEDFHLFGYDMHTPWENR